MGRLLLMLLASDALDWREQSYIAGVHTEQRVVVVVVLETLLEKGCFVFQILTEDPWESLEIDSRSPGKVSLCPPQP